MPVKKGDKVKIEYKGTLEDGNVFDTNEGKEPLEVEVGSGRIIQGFEDALIGMEKGEEKEIKIKPEDGYGEVKKELLKPVPRDKLPKEPEPKAGMVLMMKTPDGKQFPARISEVSEKNVTIDLNHPLAGKTLVFKLKIVDISS